MSEPTRESTRERMISIMAPGRKLSWNAPLRLLFDLAEAFMKWVVILS